MRVPVNLKSLQCGQSLLAFHFS
uniref:Uncharacterized protein n=1 Tax=Arundo donax TaxID=35708 RepID=A0A0A9GI20_ARUDO